MTKQDIKQSEEQVTEQATANEPQTGLTINDLTLTLQIIQVATSRGAFKADELTAVGGLYDRLFKFLEASGVIKTKSAKEVAAEQSAAQQTSTENTKEKA